MSKPANRIYNVEEYIYRMTEHLLRFDSKDFLDMSHCIEKPPVIMCEWFWAIIPFQVKKDMLRETSVVLVNARTLDKSYLYK